MTTINDTVSLQERQMETKRICDSLKGQISKEEQDRLYATIACLSRSAYNRGQFPDSTELTDPRKSWGAVIANKTLKLLSPENHNFRIPFLALTTFESDMALLSLYNSMNMLAAKSRAVVVEDILNLVEGSFHAGGHEEKEFEHPMTILGGISTW